MDADSRGTPDLLRLLKRYRLRQKVDIDDVSQQYCVWALYSGEAPALQAALSSLPPGWAPDPRLDQLGLRAVLPADAEGSGSGGGGGAGSLGSVSWRDHRRWRILHGVAEGDSEIPTGAPQGMAGGMHPQREQGPAQGCHARMRSSVPVPASCHEL